MAGINTLKKMLYCPKCRSTYEEGTQRFCSNDGGRLLPAQSEQKGRPANRGVFTSILGKMPPAPPERKPEPKPEPLPHRESGPKTPPPVFAPHSDLIRNRHERRFEFGSYDENDSILELEFDPSMPRPQAAEPAPDAPPSGFVEMPEPFIPAEPAAPEAVDVYSAKPEPPETETPAVAETPEPVKPEPKLVMPQEIPSGMAELGDRASAPAGREPFTRRNHDTLIGQTVKGRYKVTGKLTDDDISVTFLAEDQISESRKAVVRVFIDPTIFGEEFAEESVALSHLNHPNIAAVFDSGELPEGNKFIVSEFVEGESLAEIINGGRRMNPKRTARIVRQISYALSEAHQNGVLHRDLRPENVVLTVSEAGFEQSKLVNFEFSEGYWSDEDLLYKAPEEVEGGSSTPASEVYSLAVIAYRMLTGRMPFDAGTERELFRLQTSGKFVRPSEAVPELPLLIDEVIGKAMSVDHSARYPKVRDFGDAFFNALTAVSPFSQVGETKPPAEAKREFFVVPPIGDASGAAPLPADIRIDSSGPAGEETPAETEEAEVRDEASWERRSPEPVKTGNWMWLAFPIIGAVLLLAGVWGIWKLVQNRSAEVPPPVAKNDASTPIPESRIDAPPLQRKLSRPEGSERFVNSQEALKGELAKNFLPFEIFYPQGWTSSASDTNFLDVARRDPEGRPIEQMIVTRYRSRGVMQLDRQAFPELVRKSNADLAKILGDTYKIRGEGETTIQNGRWKAYEVKFEGVLPDSKLKFYGRRLWIPVQVPSVQNGFVLTLLSTELSPDVRSVDDVGVKGELAEVLETFEPIQN